MLEFLQAFMKTKHQYDVTEYAYFETTYRRSNWIPVSLSIFVVIFLVFILDLIFKWNIVNFVVLIIAFVIFVIAPMAMKKGNKYQAIIVTPQYLIEQIGRNEFVAIDYDTINSFKVTDQGVIVGAKRKKITLGLNLSREEIDQVIDILEAKGKTFDSKKEYMIRPVEIHIQDNKVQLTDIDVRTELDDIYEQFSSRFVMLTPGFIEYIILRNSNVKEVEVLDNEECLALHMDQFEVKEGHPENTKFDSIIAIDGILVFQKIAIESMILQNLHDSSVPDKKCDRTLEAAKEYLENANITEWKITKTKANFYFATGVYQLRVSFKYKDVIVGWNKTKE